MKPSTHFGQDHLSQKNQMKAQKGYKSPGGVGHKGVSGSNKTYYPFNGTRQHLGSKNKSGGGYSPKNNQVYLGKSKLA